MAYLRDDIQMKEDEEFVQVRNKRTGATTRGIGGGKEKRLRLETNRVLVVVGMMLVVWVVLALVLAVVVAMWLRVRSLGVMGVLVGMGVRVRQLQRLLVAHALHWQCRVSVHLRQDWTTHLELRLSLGWSWTVTMAVAVSLTLSLLLMMECRRLLSCLLLGALVSSPCLSKLFELYNRKRNMVSTYICHRKRAQKGASHQSDFPRHVIVCYSTCRKSLGSVLLHVNVGIEMVQSTITLFAVAPVADVETLNLVKATARTLL